MKTLIILTTISLFSISISAQKQTDVVYLKNESILRGTIIDSNAVNVKIETCCGSVWVYPWSEVLKTTKEESVSIRPVIKSKGYFNFTTMGSLVGSGMNEKSAPFSLMTEHNYRLGKHVMAGAVLGYEVLSEGVMPVGITLKGMLPHNRNIVMIGAGGGYSVSLENPNDEFFSEAHGGFFINTGLDIVFPVSENTGLIFGLGYRYNALNYTREEFWVGEIDRRVHYRRLSLRIGLSFY